jgi:hypothetical protein
VAARRRAGGENGAARAVCGRERAAVGSVTHQVKLAGRRDVGHDAAEHPEEHEEVVDVNDARVIEVRADEVALQLPHPVRLQTWSQGEPRMMGGERSVAALRVE